MNGNTHYRNCGDTIIPQTTIIRNIAKEGGGNMVKVYKSRNFEQAEIKVRISVPGKMGEQVLDAVRGYCRQQKRLCGDVFGYEIKIT